MFRQSAHEEWILPSHYVGAHTVNKLYKIPSWTDAPFSNIPIKVQIQRYRCLKLNILSFIYRQSPHEEWVLPIHYVGVHTVKKLYLITSWTNTPFSNIPIKVQIQRYRCLKLDIFGLIFRQSALEKWVLPSLNVWSCSLR